MFIEDRIYWIYLPWLNMDFLDPKYARTKGYILGQIKFVGMAMAILAMLDLTSM